MEPEENSGRCRPGFGLGLPIHETKLAELGDRRMVPEEISGRLESRLNSLTWHETKSVTLIDWNAGLDRPEDGPHSTQLVPGPQATANGRSWHRRLGMWQPGTSTSP